MESNLRWSTALRPMLAVEKPLPGVYVAMGPDLLTSWFLSALCPALRHGSRLFWVDAGNSFNAHGAAYACGRLGWDPRPILGRIQLARPFNLFQLATMVRLKLPALWRGEPVVVADPFPLFYDQDVPVAQARRIFVSVMEGMKALPAVWMILAVERTAPEGRAGWLRELADRSLGRACLEASPGPQWHLEKKI